MDLQKLEEIGEWAARGFYEGEPLPWPRSYGLALRRMYEHMEVDVPEGRYLIPHEPMASSLTCESDNTHHAEGLICGLFHSSGLEVCDDIVKRKKERYPQHAAFIDALTADLRQKLPTFAGYTHSNPDIARVVSEGFASMAAELRHETEAAALDGTQEERNLLLALSDYARGVEAFYAKTAETLRNAAAARPGDRLLTLVSREFAACFMHPSTTFIQGLLAVNFTWMLDGCDSIGRIDAALGALFDGDLAAGRLDIADARVMLDEMWLNFERLNGWNLQIGGYTADGKDGCCALTRECIACCRRNRLRRPNVAFHITKDTPEDAVLSALRSLAEGSGRPALYNDDAYLPALRRICPELTAEDARGFGFGGCTEAMIPGKSNVGSLEGEFNFAKAVELAVFDGFDPVARAQTGPHTGSFASFETLDAFLRALKAQIFAMTCRLTETLRSGLEKRLTQGDPKLYRTLFTRDCVRRRRSFEAGGARYNWSVISYQGVSNLIDSVAAISKCVFEEKSVGRQALCDALSHNFEGAEQIRRLLLGAPKFGNDLEAGDSAGCGVIRYAWELLSRFETPRDGRFVPSVILFATYADAGRAVGATPDGRRAFEVLTDSVGATQGMDRNGPTALLNSVLRLPLSLAAGTPVLNLRFTKDIMRSDEGLRKVWMLIRTYFARGGMQAQLTVADTAELRRAQREPEKYRDLIVRIGGYSEYFVGLSPALQESVIRRSEHS